MKRIIVFLIITSILTPLWAQSENDFTIELTDDDTGVIIKGYSGIVSEIQIPATIQGLPVKIIAEAAFAGNQIINSVVIPNSVTVIGVNAFLNCRHLFNITLPSGLTYIGDSVFANSGLQSVVIPEGITTIGVSAFSNCAGLVSVTLPSTIESIDYNTFNNCSDLAVVNIPGSITSIQIRNNSFSNCRSLPLASQALLRRVGYRGRF